MRMIAILFVTFRESLEMLLVISVLFTSLEQSKIQKKQDLLQGAAMGLAFSIILFIIFSFAGSQILLGIGKKTSELFEGVNYLGSGIFLFITASLIHNKIKKNISDNPPLLLDASLFAVGFLAIFREGLEIIMFSATTSILSSFAASLQGFILGIALTFLVGFVGKKYAISRISHTKLLTVADWGIKLLSLYFVIRGILVLSELIF